MPVTEPPQQSTCATHDCCPRCGEASVGPVKHQTGTVVSVAHLCSNGHIWEKRWTVAT